jgi:hypothetical protein
MNRANSSCQRDDFGSHSRGISPGRKPVSRAAGQRSLPGRVASARGRRHYHHGDPRAQAAGRQADGGCRRCRRVSVRAGADAQPAAPTQYSSQYQYQNQSQPQPSSVDPSANFPAPQAMDGTDDGIVHVAPASPQNAAMMNQGLNQRGYRLIPTATLCTRSRCAPANCRRAPASACTCLTGCPRPIRSAASPSAPAWPPMSLQGGQVLIPAGAEIDGRVVRFRAASLAATAPCALQPEP